MSTPLLLSRCAAFVATALLLAAPASAQLRLVPYVSGLSQPVGFVQDPSTSSLQYVVQQSGAIRVVSNGVLLPVPFLDLSAVISSGGERGLLGLAFPPDYGSSGRFFVNFTDRNGHTVVARFRRSLNPLVADPATRFDLRWGGTQRFIVQPFANHNGGHMAFGPDGYLYIAMGDGGSGGDPQNNAQNPATLLGKMLRIDVNVGDSDPNGYVVPADNPFVDGLPVVALHEIWAFGLRNPWKFSFDAPALGGTGAMLIGDVGQGSFEEVDYQPPGVGGRNYGWRTREGAHSYNPSPGAAYAPVIDPIAEYSHAVGHSITGGVVYRGSAMWRGYKGRYFYADFVTGRVWSIALVPLAGGEVRATTPVDHTAELGSAIGNVSAFGLDASGEIYIVSYVSGQILKMVDSRPIRQTGVSDFDGDGRADVAIWRPSTGVWGAIQSSDGGALVQQLGTASDVPAPGDYDGDGRIDQAFWRPSTAVWTVRRSSDGNTVTQLWGASGDRPVAGDYDGDLKTDFAVWRPATGLWIVLRSSDGVTVNRQWGTAGDRPVPGDYDGDRISDIAFWRPSTGTWQIIRSSDGVTGTRQWGAGYAPYNDVPVPGDYDGDGRTDIAVWRSATGVWHVIQSSNGAAISRQWGAGYAPYNDVPVPADYDGDLKTDFAVWRSSTGIWYIVRSTDNAVMTNLLGVSTDIPIPKPVDVPPVVPPREHMTTTADFDGDGKADVAVWRPSSGVWSAIRSANNTVLSVQLGTASDVPVPGDYDGDGRVDPAFWRPSTGVWTVLRSSDGGTMTQQWGVSGDQPVPGDYDGDLKTDFAVWHPASGLWEIRRSSDSGTTIQQWGMTGDLPLSADYDNDRITDIAFWRPSTGVWNVIRSSDSALITRQWGAGYAPYNDIPVPGDYDGDGAADFAVWRPAQGLWFVIRSSNGSVITRQWGAGYAPYNDVPVPADYDGDRKTDFAVWRSSSGVWYIIRSTNGAMMTGVLGVSTDLPVPTLP